MANLNQPFGFDQGDPLIVCINEAHMRTVQKAFKLKAYYCTAGAAICARRFSKVIIFRAPVLSPLEEEMYYTWIRDSVVTHIEVGGEIFYV